MQRARTHTTNHFLHRQPYIKRHSISRTKRIVRKINYNTLYTFVRALIQFNMDKMHSNNEEREKNWEKKKTIDQNRIIFCLVRYGAEIDLRA